MLNIRVICPSNSFKEDDKETINRIVNRLEKDDFKVSFGKNIFKKQKYYDCANIKDRLYDLEDALDDDNVDIIICGKGGFNSNQLLPYLKNSYKRKKFIGMSDNTVLVIALNECLDTYLGPNFLGLDDNRNYKYFLEMINKKEYKIEIKENNIIKKGNVSGNIVGANLCTLNLLQGTKYIDKKDNIILFIEDDNNYKEGTFFKEFDRNLESLIQSNLFNIKCILFGKFENSTNVTNDMLKEMIKSKIKNIPIYYNIDIGHVFPIITLPINKYCIIKDNEIIIKDML